jgi:hypothetical protein
MQRSADDRVGVRTSSPIAPVSPSFTAAVALTDRTAPVQASRLRLSRATQDRMGLAAVVGGVVGILYFPLHSLAYFASEGSSDGVVKWADAGRDLLARLLDWSSADTVYRTYGKVYLVVVLGLFLGLIALRGRRAGEAEGLEQVGSLCRPARSANR